MRFRRAALLALVALLGLLRPLRAEDDAAPVFSDEERALLDVCDRLGWTDAAARGPFAVEELVDGELPTGPEELARSTTWGWILAESDGVVSLLDGAGVRRVVRRVESSPQSGEAVLRPSSPEDAAAFVVQPQKRDWFLSLDGARRAGPWSGRVIGAAQFRRAGRADLARRLLDALEPWKERSALDVAREQVALRALWRVVADFEDPGVPRADLLRRLRVWDAAFRGTEHAAMAADLLRELERMVPEDEVRAARIAPQGARTPAAAAEDLVWLLRDCGFGAQLRLDEPDGRQLDREFRALGWDAVPALLAALDDTRTTRCVKKWREFHFPGHRVLRVGDLALDVLEEIVCERFERSEGSFHCGDPRWEDVVARARSWWRAEGPKGEAAALRRHLERATDWTVERSFDRLAEIDSAGALALARRDLDAASHDAARMAACARIARVPGDASLDVLRRLQAPDTDRNVRIRAAVALHERGEVGMKPVLLALWGAAVTTAPEPHPNALRALVTALTRCDDAAREAVAVAAATDSALRALVGGVWREEFRWRQVPAVTGAARDLLADLALDVLQIPPLVGLVEGTRQEPNQWDRREAAAVLARVRGSPFDRDARPIERFVAEQALVAAECADRGMAPPPPAPALVASAEPPQVAATTGAAPPVGSLSLAVGNRTEPGDAALAPLRALVGKPPDADSVEDAVRGAFRARPDACGQVVLRLWRSDGPWRAEVLFLPGTRGAQIEHEFGDGDGFGQSWTVFHLGDAPATDLAFDRFLRARVAAALRDGARRGGILDLRMASKSGR